MKKRDFEAFIKTELKELPLEEQEELLKKIRYSWIPDINEKFNNRIQKSYIKCSKCRKYSLKRKFSIKCEEITRYGVTVFVSLGGEGDDDEVADVTYLVTYYVCPKCGDLTEIDETLIAEKNRHKRK